MSAINAQNNQLDPATLEATYRSKPNYTEVCWLTAHNAFPSYGEGRWYAQQNLSFQRQYEFGVRSFILDLYWYRPQEQKSHHAPAEQLHVHDEL